MKQYRGLGLLCLFVIPGCVVGPKYKRTEPYVPERYSIPVESGDNPERICWWKSFEDAQLENLIKKGLTQNFDIKSALEKIEQARNLNRIEFAQLLPEIDFFSDVLKINLGDGLLTNGRPTGNVNARLLAIDTLWEIDLWGRLRRNQKAAEYHWEAQIEDLRDALVMIAAEIAQTYIALCALHNRIVITQNNIELDLAILSLNKDTYSSGLDSLQVPLQQEISVDQRKEELIDLIVQKKIAWNKLAFLLGITPDKLELEPNQMSVVPLPKHEVRVEKPYELFRRRPDIRKAERLLAASYEEVGAAMAEWFPKITLFGFLGKPYNSGGSMPQGNEKLWAIGPLFTWPIIDFGRIYFNIKAKQSSQRQALLTYEKRVTNAVQEVENWLISYVEEKKKFNIIQGTLHNQMAQLCLAKTLFIAGLASEVTVLIHQKEVNENVLERIDSEEKIASHFIALYKAFGGDW